MNFFNVVAQVRRRKGAFRATVAAIVPNKDVYPLVDKETKVVRVALMDHLLIEHCV